MHTVKALNYASSYHIGYKKEIIIFISELVYIM